MTWYFGPLNALSIFMSFFVQNLLLIKESRKLKTTKFQFIERTLFYSLTNDFTPVRFLKDGNDSTENGMVRLMKKIIIVLVLFTPEFN